MLELFKQKQRNSHELPINFFNKENNTENLDISLRDEYKNLIHYPSSTKEWSSSVYSYNKSYLKPLVVYNGLLNILFSSYSNMLQSKSKVKFNRRRHKKSRYSADKLYISKAELKHTNINLTIFIFLYNKQKVSIEQYLRKLLTCLTFYRKKVKVANLKDEWIEDTANKNRIYGVLKNKFNIIEKWNKVSFRFFYNLLEYFSLYIKKKKNKLLKILSNFQKKSFNNIIFFNFNKFKFNNVVLSLRNLGLISLIQKLYDKKIVVKLVEQKSIHLNSDVFSSAVALKLRDRQNKAVRVLRKAVLNMVKIPDLHTLITFDDSIESMSLSMRDIESISMSKSMSMSDNNIINTMNQQVVSGVRFEAAGRLTRRLTAMRAIFKYRYEGSLKNIRSSFNNKSSTILRGFIKSNSQYTIINSKTRNGTFGLKGWISSHLFVFSSNSDTVLSALMEAIKIDVTILSTLI